MGADLYKKITDYFIRHLAGVRRVSFERLSCPLLIDKCRGGISNEIQVVREATNDVKTSRRRHSPIIILMILKAL